VTNAKPNLIPNSNRPMARGWARVDASRTLKRQQMTSLQFRRRAGLWIDRNPLLTALYSQLAIALIALISFAARPSFAAVLAPEHPDEVLAVAWQVHTGFSAIAFAGLVLLIDMAGRGSHITVTSERRFLLRHTRFLLAFMFALMGAVQISVIATWFPSDATVFVELLFVLTPTIYLVGRAYFQAVSALTLPRYLQDVEQKALQEQLRASMDTSHVISTANATLEGVIERAWVVDTASGDSNHYLVFTSGQTRLTDVHIPTITSILASLNPSTLQAGQVSSLPTEPAPHRPVKLAILANIAQMIPAGRPLFAVSSSIQLTPEELGTLDRKLTNAVYLEDE
jgi:hypothetical protein